MDRKTKIIFSLILTATVACSRAPSGPTTFRSESFHLSGELPAGWEVDTNNTEMVMLLSPDFVERECPTMTVSAVARPITAEYARNWHAIESRPIAGRENKVGPLRQATVAGMSAWSYEESAIHYPELMHPTPGQARPKPVRVRSVTYLLATPSGNIEIQLSAPDSIYDKHKPELDHILASLKQLP